MRNHPRSRQNPNTQKKYKIRICPNLNGLTSVLVLYPIPSELTPEHRTQNAINEFNKICIEETKQPQNDERRTLTMSKRRALCEM